MLIQPCRILPSDGFSFWLAISKQLHHLLYDLSASEKPTARWFEVEFFCLGRSHLLFLLTLTPSEIVPLVHMEKLLMVSCVVLSTCYMPYMDSHCGSCFGFLESLSLGFLVFNFHLGRITVINDLNESSFWAVRMNSWNKPAHWSVWNSEWIGARG